MSLAQISATTLLCRLMEHDKPEINGMALLGGEHCDAGRDLLRERLLVIAGSLSWVTCPECGVELARVVRELAHGQLLLRCDQCGEVNAGRSIQQTYKVSLPKVVDRLMTGLGLTQNARKEIETDVAWRIGTTEPSRGKPLTWYFARHLNDGKVARHLLEQIRLDKSSRSSRIITSTEVPLQGESPLREFDVVNLSAVARISQSKFELFAERMELPGPQPGGASALGTSLKRVRSDSVAYVDGIRYALEPRQRNILLALIDDRDHEMDRDALRTASGSQAKDFSPSKAFDRNALVYQTFIRFQRGDEVYMLTIADEDRDWLT